MRNFYLLLIVMFFITACTPDDIATQVDNRIKSLTIISGVDSVKYDFLYNNNQVVQVLKNNNLYADVNYGNLNATIIKYYPYTDTFLVSYTINNYINTIIGENRIKSFYRNNTEELDSIRNIDNSISLYHNNISLEKNNIIYYNQLLPYTCGFYNTCYSDSRDTILYTNYAIQTNLPEQFISVPISEGISLFELNPIYIMQLSGILSYKPCKNLRAEWKTRYSILITQSTPNRFHFKYEYLYDNINRVTKINIFNIANNENYLFKTYLISYFL
ncbi:MAG: hypothetical protein H6553_05565 [Chitinophagales bacterium]|nr:hypothetical protein [Chitinophagales bacterium]